MNTKTIKDAVASLLQWLEDHGYSRDTVAIYRSRSNDILDYTEQEEKKFDLESYLKWAESHTAGRSNSTRCCLRKSLVMLDCVINGKPITAKTVSSVQPLKLSNLEYPSLTA